MKNDCLILQNLDDSDWTNSMYTSPVSGMENTSFFTDDITNLSSALLKEDDPGEAGEGNKHTQVPSVSLWLRYSCTNTVVSIFSAAASLFPEFLGAFLKYSSSAVFDLLDDYQALCQDKVGCV